MIARRALVLSGAAVLFAGATPVSAQNYPDKNVRVIVPFGAGGAPDVVARVLAQALTEQTGKSFVVENRPGADGVLGSQVVAESPPDGLTLLVTSSSFVINPSFHKKLPFDVLRDFEPVSNIAMAEAYILGVTPALPVQSVQDLIALAKKPDQKISFGSPGVGNALHLAAELFKSLTHAPMVHVPYRSSTQAMTGLIAGDVQVMFMTPPASMPYIESGKIHAIGYTGLKRFARLSDVPTLIESGVRGLEELSSWTGMFAPAKTSPAVLAQIHAEVAKGLATPAVRERLEALGVIPQGTPPAEFKPYVATQVRKIADIVRAAGIEPQ